MGAEGPVPSTGLPGNTVGKGQAGEGPRSPTVTLSPAQRHLSPVTPTQGPRRPSGPSQSQARGARGHGPCQPQCCGARSFFLLGSCLIAFGERWLDTRPASLRCTVGTPTRQGRGRVPPPPGRRWECGVGTVLTGEAALVAGLLAPPWAAPEHGLGLHGVHLPVAHVVYDSRQEGRREALTEHRAVAFPLLLGALAHPSPTTSPTVPISG